MGEENQATESGDSRMSPENALVPIAPLFPEKGRRPASVREWMAWRTASFNSRAAGNLRADIQFQVTGTEAGEYVLRVKDGHSEAYEGTVPAPSLAIHTSSEVWLEIARGELSGPKAYRKGLYTAQGDLGLLLRLRALFTRDKDGAQEAPGVRREEAATPGRPTGPPRLKGTLWLLFAFLPWYLHWVSKFLPAGAGRYWTGLLLPLGLAALLWIYRRIFHRSTLFEAGTLAYFLLFYASMLVHNGFFVTDAGPLSFLTVGLLWTASLATAMPLTGQYVQWDYPPAMRTNAVFLSLNRAITGVWAVIFLLHTVIALVVHYVPSLALTALFFRLLLVAAGLVFTARYPNWYVSYGIVRETGG